MSVTISPIFPDNNRTYQENMLYLLIIFSGAFLLFQVQPVIAKVILPLFGGGAAVWTACLLFFQALLLLGYLYSHYLTKINDIRKQVVIHTCFLLISLFFLPINLVEYIGFDMHSPLMEILILLTLSIGAPYFMLAATAPLVQRWLSFKEVNKLPYKLYSLSNFGSLLALLSYPFVIEPLLTNQQQSIAWSIFYLVFVLLFLSLGMLMTKQKLHMTSSNDELHIGKFSKHKEVLLWLLLSAVGVILLVSTTNALTQNIPPVPFLWILPLCIYLITFIISFHSIHWYVRWYWFVIFVLASFAAILLFFIGSQFDIITQIVLYSLVLLSACMICHCELVLLKPKVEKLTLFYLNIAAGGFMGSFFVAFVAKNLFSQFYEFPLAITLVYLLFASSILLHKTSPTQQLNTAQQNTTISKPLMLSQPNLLLISTAISVLMFIALFFYLNNLFSQNNIINSRNFYGILSVKDIEIKGVTERRLIDGTTSHGTQYVEAAKQHIPLSYYRANTGIAIAIDQLGQSGPLSIGIIGLGAGTLAAYGRENDDYTFYELNPNVISIAQSHFSYLQQSAANIDLVLGDGRISLSRELANKGSQQYQLLIIDAFSGDSIPAHLLTREAFDLYWQHLDNRGVLVIHISNSHLDLTPLVRGLSDSFDKQAVYIKTIARDQYQHDAEWVLISNKSSEAENNFNRFATDWPGDTDKSIIWTDNYSNLLSVIK